MAEKTDRRCFLARGMLGAAAIGAAHSSIEEKTLMAAIDEGAAQAAPLTRPSTDIAPGSMPCGQIRDVSQPAVHWRKPDRRLGSQP